MSLSTVNQITVEQVLYAHDRECGTCFYDVNLLESAVNSPFQTFGDEFLNQSIFLMAAALTISLVKNHAFDDGNKRTATISLVLFLKLNHFELTLSELNKKKLVLDIANGLLLKEDIAILIEQNTQIKKD